MVETVDSVKLANELNKTWEKLGKGQRLKVTPYRVSLASGRLLAAPLLDVELVLCVVNSDVGRVCGFGISRLSPCCSSQ